MSLEGQGADSPSTKPSPLKGRGLFEGECKINRHFTPRHLHGGLKGRVHSMFRLFKHYVPYAVVWLALIEFAALLLSAEAAWHLYAHLSDFDAGPIGDRWLDRKSTRLNSSH